MLHASNCPRSKLEPFRGQRLTAHLAQAVAAVGHAVSGPTYLLQHGEQMLLRGHSGEPIYRHRGPVADTLAERNGADLSGRFGQLRQLALQVLLPLRQQTIDVRIHLARVGRAAPVSARPAAHQRPTTTGVASRQPAHAQ